MKRLIEIANNQIKNDLMAIIDTGRGRHLSVEEIQNYRFSCMATDISWRDVPEDLDLSGYEVRCINVLYGDCRISITFGEYRNIINILLPRWAQEAMFSARMQGQKVASSLIEKLTEEHKLVHKGETIPYVNTVS